MKRKYCLRKLSSDTQDGFTAHGGFTLIELLVSMTVIMVLGTIILVIFFTALRGTNRTQELITTRQEGNYAMSTISRMIRQAESIVNVEECSDGKTSTKIVLRSGIDNQISTFSFDAGRNTIASVSGKTKEEYLLIDSSNGLRLQDFSFACGMKESTKESYVTVKFTLIPEGGSDAQSSSYSSTVLLKNAKSALH